MSTSQLRVKQVDHIELRVPDQYEAAQWYRQIFGLEIIPEYEVTTYDYEWLAKQLTK